MADIMGLQTSFDVLSTVIERYESRGWSIRSVEATTGDDGTLRASLEVPVSALAGDDGGEALSPERAALTDGGLQVSFSLPDGALPGATEPAATAAGRDVHVEADGSVVLAVDLVIDGAAVDDDPGESEPSTDASTERTAGEGRPEASGATGDPADGTTGSEGDATGRTTEPAGDTADGTAESGDDAAAAEPERDPLAAVRDDSVPPYEDTAYLSELYATCETFAEMSRRIEMDVSAETVRRYMIDAGVHDPTTYDTDGAGEDHAEQHRATADGTETAAADEAELSAPTTEEPERAATDRSPGEASNDPVGELADEQLVTDGLGLAADIDVEEIVDAVVDSHTMYEVTSRLETDPDRTRELLRQLNLIDLVLCRANDERADEVTPERVATRIRQCAPGGA